MSDTSPEKSNGAAYNRAMNELDVAIRTVDRTLAEMRAGAVPDWRSVSQQAGRSLANVQAWLNTLSHTGMGAFDVPISTPVEIRRGGPFTAVSPQGMTTPTGYYDGMDELTLQSVQLHQLRYLLSRMRDEQRSLYRRKQQGLSGFWISPSEASFLRYASMLMLGACAYHGYMRNNSVWGALKWAFWPAIFGVVGGGAALAVAAKQGFGKKA